MKSNMKRHLWQFTLVLGIVLIIDACKHEPVFQPMDPPGAGDTTITDPGDTNTVDPGDTIPVVGGHPCDPDTVYFEKDILPILASNCAKSGCHDANTRQDGVELTNYAQVINTGDVRPFDPESSDLYEVITEDDPDKVMPPPPNALLGSGEIALIRKWIEQGAQNLSCDDTTSCDTLDVRFSSMVQPILQTHCVGCHSGSNPSGGISLNSHSAVLGSVNSGQLLGAIFHEPGFVAMPQGANKLPDCEIHTIKAWVNQGAKDN